MWNSLLHNNQERMGWDKENMESGVGFYMGSIVYTTIAAG